MTRIALIALVFLGVLALAAAGGYSYRDNAARAEIAELKDQHKQAVLDAVAKALAEKARVDYIQKEAADAEHLRRLDAEAAARRAAVAAERLRGELEATRARVASLDLSVAEGREAAVRTVSVLAELLDRCSERRRELALYADQAASAGRLCERNYDALIGPRSD